MYSRLVFLNMHRADGKTDKEIVAHASHGFDTLRIHDLKTIG